MREVRVQSLEKLEVTEVAETQALAAGDEGLKTLSIRGRQCSSNRSELWQDLSEKLGWRNVEPVAPAATERSDS